MNLKVNICGVEIDNISFKDALAFIEDLIKNRKNTYIVTPNADHIIKLQKDDLFKVIYREAGLVVPDGVPLLWAGRFLEHPIRERVNGTDLFEALCKIASDKGYKLFFLGGRPGAALGAAEVMKIRHPLIKIVGVYSPPFGFEGNEEENSKIVEMIKASNADILFVGLGAPKQEKWIYKHRDNYQVPVSLGIGVSFELVSGIVKRAPLWMQKIGLEWFWRLLMEPARLWKRYLIDDMYFFWLVLKQKMSR